ncbi:MAG: CHASE2 domain-containing protein [Stenomitos frigidus ULC029]
MTAIVTVVRILGLMQPLEFAAYDQMMLRLKPSEKQDERLLIVAVNDQDILEQSKRNEPGAGTIKDPSLQKLIQKLQQYKPHVIGLDVLRDFSADKSTRLDQWLKLLTEHKVLIGICTSPDGTITGQGARYPVALSPDQVKSSVGFSNYSASDSDINRIQLLLNPILEEKVCPTEQSFSFAIARHYLEAKGIPYQPPATQDNKYAGDLRLGETTIKRRTGLTAGYQGDLSEPPSYQLLLNYRSW